LTHAPPIPAQNDELSQIAVTPSNVQQQLS
jgi:hypothetical protein